MITARTFAAVFLLATCGGGIDAPSDRTPVPPGTWGGKGIQMTVTSTGATIEYDCAAGTVDERLLADGAGNFAAAGTHAFGQGGPREKGDRPPKPHAARYEGTRMGSEMRLTVSLPELGRTVGEFTLELGHRGSLDRCG